jgi:hypothetical protein
MIIEEFVQCLPEAVYNNEPLDFVDDHNQLYLSIINIDGEEFDNSMELIISAIMQDEDTYNIDYFRDLINNDSFTYLLDYNAMVEYINELDDSRIDILDVIYNSKGARNVAFCVNYYIHKCNEAINNNTIDTFLKTNVNRIRHVLPEPIYVGEMYRNILDCLNNIKDVESAPKAVDYLLNDDEIKGCIV